MFPSRAIDAKRKRSDDFHLTYEIGDYLLDSFREDISCKKGKGQ